MGAAGQAGRGSSSVVPVARLPMARGLLLGGKIDITTLYCIPRRLPGALHLGSALPVQSSHL